MSDEMMEEFESRLKALDVVVRLGRWLLVGAFAIGVWVATLEIRQNAAVAALEDHEEGLKQHEVELHKLTVLNAESLASRYTAQQAALDKSLVQAQLNGNDKRIALLEESLKYIRHGLDRVEEKLGTQPK